MQAATVICDATDAEGNEITLSPKDLTPGTHKADEKCGMTLTLLLSRHTRGHAFWTLDDVP